MWVMIDVGRVGLRCGRAWGGAAGDEVKGSARKERLRHDVP